MKTFTVTATVNHGDYRHTETATADSAEDALLAICKTSMGIGYAPKPGSDQLKTLAALLALKGSHQFGWGDYTLTIQDK